MAPRIDCSIACIVRRARPARLLPSPALMVLTRRATRLAQSAKVAQKIEAAQKTETAAHARSAEPAVAGPPHPPLKLSSPVLSSVSSPVSSPSSSPSYVPSPSPPAITAPASPASPARPAPLPTYPDAPTTSFRGRLGYPCLNTLLRARNPAVFCARTCRLERIRREGLEVAKTLGLQNTADLATVLRWNEHFGIRFFRLSSDLFPFASHAEAGYTLEFADEALQEAGRVVNAFRHRVTMHPGQYTQLASPRAAVVEAAVRDLAYHDEVLRRMKLDEPIDRDAVLVIHMGGTFGDKDATLARFRGNYARLPQSIRARLVLENDDVSWSVEDLLPVCEELDIPLVLDWHHHTIVPGTLSADVRGVLPLAERIAATWTRKRITQKQHYSEAAVRDAVVPHQRRHHSDRVRALPPCASDMDLMIEAKQKEQAVFELRKLHGMDGCPAEIFGWEYDEKLQGWYPEGEEGRLKRRRKRRVQASASEQTVRVKRVRKRRGSRASEGAGREDASGRASEPGRKPETENPKAT